MAARRDRPRSDVEERGRRGRGRGRRRVGRDRRRRHRRPFWGLAFSIGGVAGGTIALVSQRFGADARAGLGLAVRSSVFLVVAATLPVTAVFRAFPTELVVLLSSDPEVVRLGGASLRVVGLGVPSRG